MQPQSTLEILNHEIQHQADIAPGPEDQNKWLTRYLFVPFRDRPLTPMYQSLYGITKLRQGIIQPFHRFERVEMDYMVIARQASDMLGTSYGVTEQRLDERAPSVVVAAIIRDFNPHNNLRDEQDNGITEIDCLLGVDDWKLIRELQVYCLPQLYNTARGQMQQLTQALDNAEKLKARLSKPIEALVGQVAQKLLDATEVAIDWALHNYENIQAQVEAYGHNPKEGKRRLSPRDEHVCAWLELPKPRLATRLETLANLQQAAAAKSQPGTGTGLEQGQCTRCGNLFNFLPDGRPPEICATCNGPLRDEAPASTKKQAAKPPAAPKAERGLKALEVAQAEAKEKQEQGDEGSEE